MKSFVLGLRESENQYKSKLIRTCLSTQCFFCAKVQLKVEQKFGACQTEKKDRKNPQQLKVNYICSEFKENKLQIIKKNFKKPRLDLNSSFVLPTFSICNLNSYFKLKIKLVIFCLLGPFIIY
ncbi:hypothetical protein BpHYR1_036052 [Brachionus plicatilis]|uniref:Uncharacterized protein n=1 Tax=Brachionus plicatilis TaxID=10195 RepID=A0A3M7RZ18_BRAPC|nr:hypothetical protein BpHYR1_036052 [Brachionus plicatilis]